MFIRFSSLAKLFILLVLLSPIAMWAAWNDGTDTGSYTYGTTATGFHIPNGSSEDIKQWTACKRVAPSGCGGSGLFVPTKTSVEWLAFLSNVPACATITTLSCY